VRRFRRTDWAVFFYEDAVLVNIRSLLSGELDVARSSGVVAASALTGEETRLSPIELEALARLASGSWTSADELGDEAEVADRLSERGLVVTDDDSGPSADLRRCDEQLTAEQWERYAALFHFMGRTRPGQIAFTLEEAERLASEATGAIEAFVAEHGAPPPAFHRRKTPRSYPLAVDSRAGGLYDTLRARRTARTFVDAPVSFAELSALLHYTFGCHGYWRYTDTVMALRKTAPSGGGLHPIEAYAIVLNAEGAPSGTYHYNVERHALDLLMQVSPEQTRSTLVRAACGQEFVATAGVVVVLAVRFFRSFWKYRRDARAYAVLLMDAGHLMQTFQLVATELGLGSFVTAAIDGPTADALIDVDGGREGVIALCGCGRTASERSVLDIDAAPYVAGASNTDETV